MTLILGSKESNRAYAVYDTAKQTYMTGYKHALDIALFRTVAGAKAAVTHELKYVYNDPDKGKKFADQSRFQVRSMTILDTGLAPNA